MSNGCLLFSAADAFFKTDNGIPLSLTGNIKTDILPPRPSQTRAHQQQAKSAPETQGTQAVPQTQARELHK